MNISQWKPSTRWATSESLQIGDVLYELEGPAIFTSNIGLDKFLFFKVEPRSKTDVFLVARTTDGEIAALERGAVSVRGLLHKDENWLVELDLDHRIVGFDRGPSTDFTRLLPPSGLPIYSNFDSAPDFVVSAESPLVFKFAGPTLGQAGLPLRVFKNLVESVHESVRRAIVPPSLAKGRSIELLDFPVRPPAFRSLLIPLGHPEIDTKLLKRRPTTKSLDPDALVEEAEIEGARFAENVERTVEKAASGKLTKSFARDYRETLENIFDLLPNDNTEISNLFFASGLNREHFSADIDRKIGEEIYETFRSIRKESKEVTGKIVGQTERSKRLLIRNRLGREITVYLAPTIYDSMLAQGDLVIGQNLQVSGDLQKRSDRDLMNADGRPKILK